jgi:hypothetical protein
MSNLPLSAFWKRKYSSKQPPLNFKSTFFFFYPIGDFISRICGDGRRKISILKKINFLLPSTGRSGNLRA